MIAPFAAKYMMTDKAARSAPTRALEKASWKDIHGSITSPYAELERFPPEDIVDEVT
jgi:hypothetical protein